MNRQSLLILAAVTVLLLLAVFFVERSNDSSPLVRQQLLLPGLRDQADLAEKVRIVWPDRAELTLQREADQWVIPARDNYAVDLGKLRPLVVALAEARIVEEKTSNPELYQKLAVDDPVNGGSGTRITIEGADFSHAVIFGDSAMGNSRYARSPGEATSYLVDQDPSLPDAVGDWLLPDIIDIDAQRVRRVSIRHADGEVITIEKSAADLTDYTVLDVPPGRELSFATVGNNIAATLAALQLEDVRKARKDGPARSSAVFDTWDGLQITVEVSGADDDAWVAFSANPAPATTSTDGSNERAEEVTGTLMPEDEAAEINDRLSGWQYKLPDFKKNQLTRRWDDLLKSAELAPSTG